MALDTGPMGSTFDGADIATGVDAYSRAQPDAEPVTVESLVFAPGQTLGEGLRAAREFLGLDLQSVADATKIRGQYLSALEAMDLGRTLPDHQGSVALLDVLQYLDPPAQVRLLDAACAMVAPGGRLFIRSGLATPGWRPRVSKAFDTIAAHAGWMYSPPKRYPDEALFRDRLGAAGLRYEIAPLNGNSPFNNWRIVAER